jgi:acyl-CoA thioester hydrolase
MSGALIDMILARTEIDYRSPVSYGEKLDVFVRTSLIKRSSIVFEYAVQARSDERVVAEARTVVVCYDYDLARSRPVSMEMKAAILAQDQEARVEI